MRDNTNRIFPGVKDLSQDMIRTYKTFATPHISDNMQRLYAMDSSIRPYYKSGTLAGRAFTVKNRPGDNLLIHKAIDMAGEGDVIVVETGGDTTNAVLGEIMVRLAKKNGIEGFVVDGAIRDSEALYEMNYPVFAKGVTHRGPYKDGPGEINVPIQLGSAVIHPGDMIVGDMDGVAVVPKEEVEEIAEKVKATAKKENDVFKSIEEGTIDRTWVDAKLKSERNDSI